jgi:hypothetical protein
MVRHWAYGLDECNSKTAAGAQDEYFPGPIPPSISPNPPSGPSAIDLTVPVPCTQRRSSLLALALRAIRRAVHPPDLLLIIGASGTRRRRRRPTAGGSHGHPTDYTEFACRLCFHRRRGATMHNNHVHTRACLQQGAVGVGIDVQPSGRRPPRRSALLCARCLVCSAHRPHSRAASSEHSEGPSCHVAAELRILAYCSTHTPSAHSLISKAWSKRRRRRQFVRLTIPRRPPAT